MFNVVADSAMEIRGNDPCIRIHVMNATRSD